MNDKKVKTYGIVLGVLLFLLLAVGITYAVLAWKSSNISILGNAECLDINYVKGNNISDEILLFDESQIINNNKITIKNGMGLTNVTAGIKSNCTIDGYITINLNVSSLNSTFTSSGTSNGALKYVLASYDPSTYTTVNTTTLNNISFNILEKGSITQTGIIKIHEEQLSNIKTKGYLLILYIDGDLVTNYTGDNITASLEAVVTQGKIAAATFIRSLFTPNTTVTNNNITYNYDTSNNLMEDIGGNVRYYGASPDNYIYFNCSDYSNQSDSTCEKWRIIGVFDGKVKIMRNESIGSYAWDQDKNIDSSVTTYDNDWSTASLQVLLNQKYYNGDTAGTITYYSNYDGSTSTSLDMSSIGIKNSATRNLISDTLYYLGGWDDAKIYSDTIYEKERGTTVYSGRPTTWTEKIALPYPSDYGYAADLGSCTQTLWDYDNSTCTSTNWMKSIFTSSYNWLLTPYSGNSNGAWVVMSSGYVNDSNGSCNADGVAPVLYLGSEQEIGSGTGTNSDPYRLSVS